MFLLLTASIFDFPIYCHSFSAYTSNAQIDIFKNLYRPIISIDLLGPSQICCSNSKFRSILYFIIHLSISFPLVHKFYCSMRMSDNTPSIYLICLKSFRSRFKFIYLLSFQLLDLLSYVEPLSFWIRRRSKPWKMHVSTRINVFFRLYLTIFFALRFPIINLLRKSDRMSTFHLHLHSLFTVRTHFDMKYVWLWFFLFFPPFASQKTMAWEWQGVRAIEEKFGKTCEKRFTKKKITTTAAEAAAVGYSCGCGVATVF